MGHRDGEWLSCHCLPTVLALTTGGWARPSHLCPPKPTQHRGLYLLSELWYFREPVRLQLHAAQGAAYISLPHTAVYDGLDYDLHLKLHCFKMMCTALYTKRQEQSYATK